MSIAENAYNSSCFFSDFVDTDGLADDDVAVVDQEDVSSTTIVDVTVAVVVIVLSSSSPSSLTSVYFSVVGTALSALCVVVDVVDLLVAVVVFVFCFDESIIIFRNAD